MRSNSYHLLYLTKEYLRDGGMDNYNATAMSTATLLVLSLWLPNLRTI